MLFQVTAWTLLCGRHSRAPTSANGYLHQLSLSSPNGCPAPMLLLKGAPESAGLPVPLLHVIFICLIKANLIKAGMAEMRKSSSEHRSWPDRKRGPLSPYPRAAASWATGHPGEWAKEPRTKEGALLGQAGLTSLYIPFANQPERNQRKNQKNENTLKITAEKPCENRRAQAAHWGRESQPLVPSPFSSGQWQGRGEAGVRVSALGKGGEGSIWLTCIL